MMISFSEYIQEASSLGDGEAWGVIDGKFVPCDAKTMIVLRGAHKGEKAEMPPKKEKKKLPENQYWFNGGTRSQPIWLIVDKNTEKVVGGHGGSKYIGMNVYKNRLLTDKERETERRMNNRIAQMNQRASRYYYRNGRKYWADKSGEPTGDPYDE